MKSTQKTWNVHGQHEKFAFSTQRNLYSTDLRLGLASGVTQILGLASGVKHIFAFLDINMLVSPKQNCGVGGLGQRKAPTQKCCVAVEYRLNTGLVLNVPHTWEPATWSYPLSQTTAQSASR